VTRGYGRRIELHAVWPGLAPTGALILPIPVQVWAPPASPVQLDGVRFAPKSELHVTLLGRDKLRRLYGESRLRRHAVRGALREAFQDSDWSFARNGPCLRMQKLRKGGARIGSIIELVDLPGLAAFVERVRAKTGVDVPPGPAHVTLYTSGDPRGIGVPDEAALRELTLREVGPEELCAAS
jgi:hypothetical protein